MSAYGYVTPTTTRRLGLVPPAAEAAIHEAVREFQAEAGIPVTGELTPATEAALAARAHGYPTPLWWPSDSVVAERVGDEDAVRRFQSQAGLPVTGVVDEETARLIGD